MGVSDWMPGIGSAVSTVGGIIGQGMANRANRKEAEKSRGWSEEMWHMQNQYDEDTYNKYNSPKAMMKQYDEAGLSKQLMYGKGGAGMNPSGSSVGGVTSPDMKNTMEGFNPIGSYLEIKNASADIETKKAQTEKTYSEISLNEWKELTEGMTYSQKKREREAYEEDYGYNRKLKKAEVLQSDIKTLGDRMDLAGKEADVIGKILQNESDSIELAWKDLNMMLQATKSYREIKKLGWENKISKEEYDYMVKNEFKMGASSALVGVLAEFLTGGRGVKVVADGIREIVAPNSGEGKNRNVKESKGSDYPEGGYKSLDEMYNMELN